MGWDKETRERYPESWALVHAKLISNGYIGMKGKKQSDLQKRRAKDANIGNKHALGKHWGWSEEAKKRIIGTKAVRLGMKSSATHKKRQSISLKGWTNRMDPIKKEEWRRKIKVARARQILPLQDTHIELMLQDELSRRKIPFEKHKQLHGLPDIFIEPNICIFADGDYWHANPEIHLPDHGIRFGMKVLTATQIQEKDKKVTDTLVGLGYKVFRFWENEIHKDVAACIDRILPPH